MMGQGAYQTLSKGANGWQQVRVYPLPRDPVSHSDRLLVLCFVFGFFVQLGLGK